MSVPSLFTIPKNLLFSLGLPSAENTHYQLPPEELINGCLEGKEGYLSNTPKQDAGKDIVAPKPVEHRFIVKDATTGSIVDWNKHHPLTITDFDSIYRQMIDYLGTGDIWIRDLYADVMQTRLRLRVINEDPCGNLFAYNMFISPGKEDLESFNPDWHIIHMPTFFSDIKKDGSGTSHFILASFSKRVILIGGSQCSREIRNAIVDMISLILPG